MILFYFAKNIIHVSVNPIHHRSNIFKNAFHIILIHENYYFYKIIVFLGKMKTYTVINRIIVTKKFVFYKFKHKYI